MAIYIDPPAWPAHGTLWSHLISDSNYDELHAFAAHLGVPRRGFDLDHYDVPASLHAAAITQGARAISARDVVHVLRGSGLRVRQADKEALKPARRRAYLEAEWRALGVALDSNLDTAEHWLRLGADLIARWNEPHRSYHSEQHLADVLLALNHLGVRGEKITPQTLLAAWFHDAVYRGEGGTDELDSAHLATESLGSLALSPALVTEVSEFIVATTPTHPVVDPPTPLVHLLDADLSIFASSPKRYAEYAGAVRIEYAHVSASDFARGRAQILGSYLEQHVIYRTAAAQELWEAQARRNVSREIEQLLGSLEERAQDRVLE